MSREIKFRAWDKKHLKYTKVLKVYFGSGGSNLGALVEDYETNYAFELQAKQAELEQYTGFKDKNGKEIYEGDIVKDGEGEMYNQVVWFRQVGGFRVAPSRRAVEFLKERAPEYLTKGEAVGWFITDDLEVVGNIHENPELIGGEE